LAISQVWPKDSSALDNPVWSALGGPHQGIAGRLEKLRWYPPAIAPFAAIPAADVVPDLDSAVRLGLEHQAYFVGVCPRFLPDGWRFVSRSEILQLFPTGEIPMAGEDAGVVLGEVDRTAMRELPRIAFPDFFRERTAELGVYLGMRNWRRVISRCGCSASRGAPGHLPNA
jgi:hypothetical protein